MSWNSLLVAAGVFLKPGGLVRLKVRKRSYREGVQIAKLQRRDREYSTKCGVPFAIRTPFN
jgi:hypothetical protein